MYAEIVLPILLDKSFTYIIPPEFENNISIGRRVNVPFGRRVEKGFIVKLTDTPPGQPGMKGPALKSIYRPLDSRQVIPDDLLGLALWMSRLYACSLGEALNCILPADVCPNAESPQNEAAGPLSAEPGASHEELLKSVENSIRDSEHKIFVLTDMPYPEMLEIYAGIISRSLKYGECIFLTPEIASINQMEKYFAPLFGGSMNTWHSKIHPRARYQSWLDALDGRKKLLLGTRSAVFAPFRKLKAIIIDDESNQSYKQKQKPAYALVDIAVKRAQMCGAAVVLGSAIPSLETYQGLKNRKYFLIPSPGRSMPSLSVKIVDLKKDVRTDSVILESISNTLRTALEQRLARNELSIILLNRKGYSNAIVCNNCGATVKCPDCAIPLSYQREGSKLKCRYCSHSEDFEGLCKECAAKRISFLGTGTERIVAKISRFFPQARVSRIDSDSVTRENNLDKLAEEIISGRSNIVIGTRLLLALPSLSEKFLKGPNPRGFTLLVFYDIDNNLYLPDFRAAERAFAVIYRLCGLLAQDGELLLQTRNPGHYFFKYVSRLDWKKFYNHELKFRKELNYPPFSRLINITVQGAKEQEVTEETERLSGFIDRTFTADKLVSSGPVKTEHPAARKKSRSQVLLKVTAEDILGITSELRKFRPARKVRISIDVNPYEL